MNIISNCALLHHIVWLQLQALRDGVGGIFRCFLSLSPPLSIYLSPHISGEYPLLSGLEGWGERRNALFYIYLFFIIPIPPHCGNSSSFFYRAVCGAIIAVRCRAGAAPTMCTQHLGIIRSLMRHAPTAILLFCYLPYFLLIMNDDFYRWLCWRCDNFTPNNLPSYILNFPLFFYLILYNILCALNHFHIQQ